MFALKACAVLSTLTAASAGRNLGRSEGAPLSAPDHARQNTAGFVRALEFRHRLRVCNAYPFGAPLDIFRGEHERLTGHEGPMKYETCRDFDAPLKVGDKLEFKIGEATTGTFAVADLPNADAVLLLVVHRHDELSTAVSFESHVFSNMDSPQVAVIDTYKGNAKGKPMIMDAEVKAKQAVRKEELRYNSVVVVNSGKYEVELDSPEGKKMASKQLVALPHESYVLLRTGVEARNGQSYPEELVVFPRSEMKVAHSGASAVQVSAFAVLLAALAM